MIVNIEKKMSSIADWIEKLNNKKNNLDEDSKQILQELFSSLEWLNIEVLDYIEKKKQYKEKLSETDKVFINRVFKESLLCFWEEVKNKDVL